jgi:hypothetical protein
LSVAAGVGVGFGPGVAAGARPDAFFCCGEAADLGFELVPEGGAFTLCCYLLGKGVVEQEGGVGVPLFSRARAAAFWPRMLLRSLDMWYLASR